jgi:hypothetical protein
MNNLQTREFEGQEISFQFLTDDMMVDATQMGRVFGKRPTDFTRQKSVDKYIEELIKDPKFLEFVQSNCSEFATIENNFSDEELYNFVVMTGRGQHGQGTYMYRPLALKFAAWLSPKFEIWIYNTIEELLFNDNLKGVVEYLHNYPIQESIKKQSKKDLKKALDQTNYNELFFEKQNLEGRYFSLLEEQKTLVKNTFVQADLFVDVLESKRSQYFSMEKETEILKSEIERIQGKIDLIFINNEEIAAFKETGRKAGIEMRRLNNRLKKSRNQ